MALQSIEGLAVTIARYVDQWGPLTFEVQEDSLLVEREPVYQQETGRDNLAFLMFRDGVRTLSLNPEMQREEIEALVDCLAHADDLADMEHDLVTALWERDLGHIDYQVVDPFLAGEVLGEGMVDTLRETVLQRLDAATALTSPTGARAQTDLGRVEPMHIEASGLRLTPQDIQSGETAIEGLSSVLQDFSEILLEISGSTPITAADDVLLQSLTAAVAAFLDVDDNDGASLLLSRLEQMETQGWCPTGTVGLVAGGAVTAEHLRRLLRESGHISADGGRPAESFLKWLRPWIVPPLLEILAETDDRAVRKTVLGVLGGEGGVPWPELEPFLRDARWYVVRNAVQLAAAAGHRQVTGHAPRLLRHPEVQVRREVVRALERFGGQAASRGLAQALTDPDSSVRTLAARAVGRETGPEPERVLLTHIESREFPSLPVEEVEAFFSAYAESAQERAIPLLDRSWRKKLFSPRPLSFRVAAVLALGHVQGPSARAVLEEASGSGEPQIKRAAAQAAQSRSSATPGGWS
jgi:HEAT repeat protein